MRLRAAERRPFGSAEPRPFRSDAPDRHCHDARRAVPPVRALEGAEDVKEGHASNYVLQHLDLRLCKNETPPSHGNRNLRILSQGYLHPSIKSSQTFSVLPQNNIKSIFVRDAIFVRALVQTVELKKRQNMIAISVSFNRTVS